MKLYTITGFPGTKVSYTAAIAVGPDAETAAKELNKALNRKGLGTIQAMNLKEIPTDKIFARILQDGNVK